MLTTPILNKDIIPFSYTDSCKFEFYYDGIIQIIKNNLIVEKVSDNTVVYDSIQETFNFYHNLMGIYLEEGNEYRAKIRVGDINGNWSYFSEWVHFWCLGNPTINIITIDYNNQNRVYNQTVLFKTEYTHPQNELLQSYKYILYDSNKNIIEVFPEMFSDGSSSLTQEITGLENDTLYYIEVKTISIHGQNGSSGIINFKPLYIMPKMSVFFEPENLSDMGAVKIKANVVQIIGEVISGTISYKDSEWVDIINGEISFNDGFNISNANFTLKLWCKNLIDDEIFLSLLSENGKIDLIKYNNRVHAFKSNNNSNIVSHFISNELQVVYDQVFMIYIKSVNDLIDIEIKI